MLTFIGWWIAATLVYGLMSSEWFMSLGFGALVALIATIYPKETR